MLLIILISLTIAFLAPVMHRLLGRYVVVPVALLALGVCAYCCFLIPQVLGAGQVSFQYTWVPSLAIDLHFRVDGLSLLFALLISSFGFLIVLYTSGYLQEHPLLGRFYMYLLLFMTAMLGLVTSDNIFCLFIFWEITSISSYLLIGFNNSTEKARVAAWQALLVTGVGGLALMAGLVLMGIAGQDITFSGLINNRGLILADVFWLPAMLLILLGCYTKSAQFPFHFWLPNAMQAPTPVSAYLHSATMVKAGIYLLARVSPIFASTIVWQYSLIIIGGITALLGAVLALLHTDLKAILAYTTISALGLMVTMLGINTSVSLKAMLVFLLAHALYKGTMFLVAGAVDHSTGTRDYTKLNGLAKYMPVTALAATLAALSMAGLMPFFGFIGKELLYEAALESKLFVWVVFALTFFTGIAFVAVATLFSFGVFWKRTKVPANVEHPPVPVLYLPPLLLGLAGLVLGLYPGPVVTPLIERAAQSVSGTEFLNLKIELWHGFTKELGLSVLTLLLGLIVYLYINRLSQWLASFTHLYRYGPDSIYHTLFASFQNGAKQLITSIQNGYLRSYIIFIILFFSALTLFSLWYDAPHLNLAARIEQLYTIRTYELVIIVLVILALIYLLGTRSRLTSIVVMGLIGYSAALVYILFGAPDVAATQFLIETLTVVIFVLLLHKLPAFLYLSHQFKKYKFIAIAILFGSVMTYTMLLVQEHAVSSKMKDFYGKASFTEAHGRNIVNVILVDFRALDTLGEITVLAVAALGIFALLRLKKDKND